MRTPRLLLSLPLIGLSTLVAADASTDTAAVRARVGAERACVHHASTQLAHWARLLGESEHQLAHGSSSAARADAAESIVVLEGRVRQTANELLACLPAQAAEPVEAALEPDARPVALTTNLRAATPRTTGRGTLEGATVLRALGAFSGGFEACYDELASRHAIVRGEATLAFTVLADGRVASARITGLGAHDAVFRGCVERAATQVGSPGRPRGGDVSIVVPLAFGPET